MKNSTFQFLVPSLSAIIEALKRVKEEDVLWIVRLQMALVNALLDANQLASAAKVINEVVDERLTPVVNNPALDLESDTRMLYDEALRLQLHVGSLKDAECQKIVPSVKKAVSTSSQSKRLSMLVKLQCLRSGNPEKTTEDAYTEIFQEATGMTVFSFASTTEADVRDFLASLDPAKIFALDAESLIEAGIQASLTGGVRYGILCDIVAEYKRKNMGPKVRLQHQTFKAILLVMNPAPVSGKKRLSVNQSRELQLSRYVDAVKSLERTLLASKRMNDPNMIERVCIISWNLCLPLFQPQLRAQVERSLNLISSSLEEQHSLLLEFRARIYLEIAKMDAASEFLSKAHGNASKGLGLDYGSIIQQTSQPMTIDDLCSHEHEWTARAIDLNFQLIKRTTQMKLAPESNFGPDDAVLGMIQEIKEAKDKKLIRQLVARCQETLESLDHGDSNQVDEVMRLTLWSEVAAAAWKVLREPDITRRIIQHILAIWFSSDKHDSPILQSRTCNAKSAMMQEVDLRLLFAEVIGEEVKLQRTKLHEHDASAIKGRRLHGEPIHQPRAPNEKHELFILGIKCPGDRNNGGLQTDNEDKTDVERVTTRLKLELLNNLGAALTAAARIGWAFALENICVYLWNLHFHIFLMLLKDTQTPGHNLEKFSYESILPECSATFESAFAALESVESDASRELLCSLALGLCILYEKSGRWDKSAALADGLLKRSAQILTLKTVGGVEQRAYNILHLKQFAEIKARAQIAQSVKDVVFPDSWASCLRVAGLLEAVEVLSHPSDESPGTSIQLSDKAQVLFERAVVLWQTVAPHILSELRDGGCSTSLENGQQHTQLITEMWTRMGFCALRLRCSRYAVECAEQALLPITELDEPGDAKNHSWQGLVVASTRLWFALAEYLSGEAIVNLVLGQTIPQKLIATASSHLADAGEYALSGGKPELVAKACLLVWNSYIRSELADPEVEAISDGSKPGDYLTTLSDRVTNLVSLLQKTPRTTPARVEFYGNMIILALDLCQRLGDWTKAFQICSDVLATARIDATSIAIPVAAMQQIQIVNAISAINTENGALANMGSSSRQKDYDPLLQAQILKQIASASSSNPPEQLKLLVTVHSELQNIKEEQALSLLDIAEWLITNCYPYSDMTDYIDNAIAILVANELVEVHQSISVQSRCGASSRGLTATPTSGNKTETERRPPIWFAEKLIRAFVMKAMTAQDYYQRLHYIALALHKSEGVWESLFNFGIEADLQTQFVQAKGSVGAAASMDYDTWKTTAELKFSVPRSFNDWASILTQLEKAPEARFYMPWAQALASVIGTGSNVITDPGLTLHYLEQLLQILQTGGRFELMLPVLCLYQTLLFGAVPRRQLSATLWIDLMLFIVMERLNLTAVLSVPLQAALTTVNSSGDTITQEIKESLSTLYRVRTSYSERTARIRPFIPHGSVDAVSKTISSVGLLLDMGFVRHAKALLQVLSAALNSTKNVNADEVAGRCSALECRVLELEGQHALALNKIQTAVTETSSLELSTFLQLTRLKSKLTKNSDEKLRLLGVASKEAGRALLRYLDTEQALNEKIPNKGGAQVSLACSSHGPLPPHSLSPSLDALVEIAQIKFQQALVFLKQAVAVATGRHSETDKARVLNLLYLSRGAFDEATGMLTSLSAQHICGRMILRYIAKLYTFFEGSNELQALAGQFDVRQLIRDAIVNMESEASLLDNKTDKLSEHALWEIDILSAKLHAASFEILFETKRNVVEAVEMTWYEHELDLKRSVVEKWLIQTDSTIAAPEGGDLAKAMALVTSVSNVVQHLTGVAELDTLAHLLRAQIQRLSQYHADERHIKNAYRQIVWTKYGKLTEEAESSIISWICANSSSFDGSPSPHTTNEDSSPDVEEGALIRFIDRSISGVQECQHSALELRSVDLVQRTAYELVQLYGCRRPFECAMSLLLYQSCVATTHMDHVLKLCLDPTNAQAIHLRRMKRTSKFHADAQNLSLPFQLSQLYLSQQSDTFKRMSLGTTSIEDVISTLPPNYRIFCLQFSPEKCFLYAALVVSGGKRCTAARIEFTLDDMTRFGELVRRVKAWRASISKTLLAYQSEFGHDDTFDYAPMNLPTPVALTAERDAQEKEMNAIISETADLLQNLFSHPTMQSELKNEIAGNPLVILADRELSCLPLESLIALEGAESIARDFSIHMLYHRISAVKTQPVRRDEVRMIVDPHKDDTDGVNTEAIIKQHCKTANSSLPWKDAVEHGQVPSVTDWLSALSSRRGGSLVYLGPNRVVGSSLPLNRLAGMNVGLTCHALLLLDQAENIASSRRQSKWDNDKAAWELEFEEDPYLRALLLSLVGVNTLVMNQWATTFSANRRVANGLLQGLARGHSIGRALQGSVDSTIVVSAAGAISGGSNTSSGASLPSRSNPPSQVNSAASLPPVDNSISGSRASVVGGKMRLKNRLRYNAVVYGLSHLVLKGE